METFLDDLRIYDAGAGAAGSCFIKKLFLKDCNHCNACHHFQERAYTDRSLFIFHILQLHFLQSI